MNQYYSKKQHQRKQLLYTSIAKVAENYFRNTFNFEYRYTLYNMEKLEDVIIRAVETLINSDELFDISNPKYTSATDVIDEHVKSLSN